MRGVQLSFVLLHLSTYSCTCAHLEANTRRQAHKRMGDGESVFLRGVFMAFLPTRTTGHFYHNVCCGYKGLTCSCLLHSTLWHADPKVWKAKIVTNPTILRISAIALSYQAKLYVKNAAVFFP